MHLDVSPEIPAGFVAADNKFYAIQALSGARRTGYLDSTTQEYLRGALGSTYDYDTGNLTAANIETLMSWYGNLKFKEFTKFLENGGELLIGGAVVIGAGLASQAIANSGSEGTGNSGGGNEFKSQEIFNEHYAKHGGELQKALGKSSYSSSEYLNDANYILKNGTYAPELNGYVDFIGGQKYGFVGLDQATGEITTFHIKTVSELIKSAPSLGFGK